MRNTLKLGFAVFIVCLAGLSCSVMNFQVVTPTPVQPDDPTAPPVKPSPRVITATRKPTNTPAPTHTPEPTATLSPTDTTMPTPEPPLGPVGFKLFSGDGMEMWLPESFIGGNLTTDLDLIIANLRNLGPEYEQMAVQLEQNRSMFILWAYDSASAQTGFLANVSVASQPVLSSVTVDDVMSATAGMLPQGFTVLEQKLLASDTYEIGRLRVDAYIQGVYASEALYFIKKDSTMWIITCAAGQTGFDQRLAEFDQAVATFKVVP